MTGGSRPPVVDSGQASLSYNVWRWMPAPSLVVDSGQASLSYNPTDWDVAIPTVVDSGQASLSYNVAVQLRCASGREGCGQRAGVTQLQCIPETLTLNLVVDSGQASLSYNSRATCPPCRLLWTAGRRHSVTMPAPTKGVGTQRTGRRSIRKMRVAPAAAPSPAGFFREKPAFVQIGDPLG